MPDRTPPLAPEGCVYGPWWDAHGKRWFCLDQCLDVLMFGTRTNEWVFDGIDFTDEITNELLRLANELGQKEARIRELEAREPDEEGQAVLWLLRRGWQIEYFDGGFGVWHDHPKDSPHFREISPIKEARKLGWKP